MWAWDRLEAIEGNRQRLDGGAMFGHVPKALWSQWMPPDEDNCIELACRSLLVDEGERRVLFETGIGAAMPRKLRKRYGVEGSTHRLVESLEARGYRPEDIDVVVLSHLHFDHAGGLFASHREGQPPRLAFPRAHYVVSEAAFARAQRPHRRDRASFWGDAAEALARTGRLERVCGATSELLGAAYRCRFSEGHTPGLLMTEVSTDRGPLVFASDLVPGKAWVHAPVTMGYDRFAERLVEEKQALLSDLAEREGWLFFTHDPEIAYGRVVETDRGFSLDQVRA